MHKYVCGWQYTMVVSSRQLRVPFEVVCLLGAVRSSEMKVMFFFSFRPLVTPLWFICVHSAQETSTGMLRILSFAGASEQCRGLENKSSVACFLLLALDL